MLPRLVFSRAESPERRSTSNCSNRPSSAFMLFCTNNPNYHGGPWRIVAPVLKGGGVQPPMLLHLCRMDPSRKVQPPLCADTFWGSIQISVRTFWGCLGGFKPSLCDSVCPLLISSVIQQPMSAVWHSRCCLLCDMADNVCLVTRQTMSAVSHSRHCLLCDTADNVCCVTQQKLSAV